MEIWRYLIGGIIMVLLLNLITAVALHSPDAPWVKLFSRTKFGPRTDVKYMTRNDLLWSAWMFLVYAAIFMVIFVGIWLIFTRRGIKGESLSLWTALAIVLLSSWSVLFLPVVCLLQQFFAKKTTFPLNLKKKLYRNKKITNRLFEIFYSRCFARMI